MPSGAVHPIMPALDAGISRALRLRLSLGQITGSKPGDDGVKKGRGAG
jgi:hypothetical protein